ncbi:helix-turn-helix transcriptional regulator [Weissella coleopterorum]|uniref:Helix-turn-helix transcriptional regulator n=1 Tax=Weissella coleopterorum TaxID=2714949 RepID=A0A6G8AY13_9LACO|nr:helix-turn-helix transcriptional regulator [Weissella coleopterorum]QIL49897.1 helix-turn-helix transcriptional regulator [Weissella coleopterorum]
MTDLTQQQKFERIKKISRDKGMSLSQLNKKANMKDNVIYSWKSKEPSATAIKKVADVLGVSVDYLLGNADEMLPNKEGTTNEPVDNSIEGIKARLVSYDGSPVTDHDAKLIKQYLDTLFEGRE